jgi:hypothetical protein
MRISATHLLHTRFVIFILINPLLESSDDHDVPDSQFSGFRLTELYRGRIKAFLSGR